MFVNKDSKTCKAFVDYSNFSDEKTINNIKKHQDMRIRQFYPPVTDRDLDIKKLKPKESAQILS